MSAPRRVGFNPLRVAEVTPLTDDAVSVRFALPPELVGAYTHVPGQYLTIRASVRDQRLLRRYSICSPAATGILGIAVKRRRDGLFSNHAVDHLRAGDVLDVMTPMGSFTAALDPQQERHHIGVAVGSGITPLRSIALSVLAHEPRSRVTLVYANRTPQSTMFEAELADLSRQRRDRFELIQVLSQGGPGAPFQGRLSPDLLVRIALSRGLLSGPALWYLSGPYDLVEALRDRLVEEGVERVAVRTESFLRPEGAPPQPALSS